VSTIKRFIPYIKPYWRATLLAPLLMVLEVAMDLLQPKILQQMVDIGIAQLDLAYVVRSALLMLGLALVGAVGGAGCSIFATRSAQSFGADLRSAAFRKVQTLSFGNLDKLETGKLITRLTNDVQQVQDLLAMALRIMVRAPLMLIGAMVMGIITSPRLALLFLVLMPLIIAVMYWAVSKARPMFTKVQRRLDQLNTVMQENLSGVRVVKAFVREGTEEARFGQANGAYFDISVRAMRLFAIVMPLVMLITNLGLVVVLWFGGVQIQSGSMQVGALIAFVNYLITALRTMMMVAMVLVMASRAQASAERVVEVLDEQPEVLNAPEALQQFDPKGYVAFDNVTFAYNGHRGDPVLHDLSFTAEPGQMVAILGATGSGKTSLVNLIPRFYDVTAGQITIDGQDVRDIGKAPLREKIGIALQEAVLFSGSIRENIRYGKPDATDEQVIAAAKAAQAHTFISELPEGYDTILGQRGVNLSGGQKQRIAIARALLLEPAILILDDSTSAVDVETEAEIQAALAELMKERTSFVIAQRISTVLNADKILVLEDGALIAEGTHETLMGSSDIYRDIYESQLGKGALASGQA